MIPSILVTRIAAHRRFNPTIDIVFTNGCFDISGFHHVKLFGWIKGRFPRSVLIVAVNSNASVSRLKPGRPINTLEHRMYVISELRSVDYVTYFDEDTPLELIQMLRPNILVKGGDYAGQRIVGQDFVEANGGKVCFFPLVEGCSTTKTIQNMGRSTTEILRKQGEAK